MTDATPRMGDNDAWLDELTDSVGKVHRIGEEGWLDLAFGKPEDIRKNTDVTRPKPIGALDLWRAEIARGAFGQVASRPSTWRSDALHGAACMEAYGLEFLRDGNHAAARIWFDGAAQWIENAARRKAEAGRAA